MASNQSTNSGEKQLNENDIISHYRELQQECNSLATKISELEMDRNEHRYDSRHC